MIKTIERPKIDNLGEMFGWFVRLEVDTLLAHDDVCAWYAPSECHDDVSRGYEAEKNNLILCLRENDMTWDDLKAEVKKRTGKEPMFILDAAIGRIYMQDSPFI